MHELDRKLINTFNLKKKGFFNYLKPIDYNNGVITAKYI